MSSDSLPGYAMKNDPATCGPSSRPIGRSACKKYFMQTCVSALSVPVTATRIYQSAFITTTMTMTKAKTNSPRLAYQVAVAVAVACCLLAVACCLTHDLFLLCCSDNSNAICVSHRLYLLHVTFFLGYFWLAAKVACSSRSQCSMHKQIFGFSCSSQTRSAKPASVLLIV